MIQMIDWFDLIRIFFLFFIFKSCISFAYLFALLHCVCITYYLINFFFFFIIIIICLSYILLLEICFFFFFMWHHHHYRYLFFYFPNYEMCVNVCCVCDWDGKKTSHFYIFVLKSLYYMIPFLGFSKPKIILSSSSSS